MKTETIAAIATARGEGGVSVLRVSGAESLGLARLVCPSLAETVVPSKLYHRTLSWRGKVGDEVLIAYFRAPRSYTGEDVVEIYAHGGSYNTQQILTWLLEAGARLAMPGEFTRRAFENGRIDLSQAQAIADLIAARSEKAHQLALRCLGGGLRRQLEALQDRVVVVLAEVEAAIDFPEEDLSFLSSPTLLGALQETTLQCRQLAETYATGRMLREGAELVLVGAPNAGKSSLLNALAGEDRAIVTAEAGTTRDPVRVEISIQGLRVSVVDTAGIREVQSEAERIGVEKAKAHAREADLCLVLLDGAAPLADEEKQILQAMKERPHLLVKNKSDLPSVWQEPVVDVCISAQSGQGLDLLRQHIAEHLSAGIDMSAEIAVAHVHQRDALLSAAEALAHACTAIVEKLPLELVAEELYEGRDALGTVTGREARSEVLDEIFRRFCIGK